MATTTWSRSPEKGRLTSAPDSPSPSLTLDALVQHEVIDRLRPSLSNFDVPDFTSRPSTTENMAFAIRDHLLANWQ
jgi:hypothetical protein